MNPSELRAAPSADALRRFAALYLPSFSILVGCWTGWRSGDWWEGAAIAGAGLLLALVALLSRSFNNLIYRGIVWITLPIGWVVFHLLLGIVFFVVLTPLGLVGRLFGRDPLDLSRRRAGRSFWHPARRRDSDDSYFDQF